jgi:hypothetical protein
VKKGLKDNLGDERLYKEYNGDKALAYNNSIHSLRHRADGGHFARTDAFRQANRDFVRRLGQSSIEKLEVVPTEDDARAWTSLCGIYRSGGFRWMQPSSRGTYDVWKIAKTYYLEQGWPNRSMDIFNIVMQDPAFLQVYDLHSETESSEVSEGYGFPSELRSQELRYSVMAKGKPQPMPPVRSTI